MNGCLRSPAAYRVLDIMHGLDHVHLERRHAYASARNDAWRFGTLAYVGTMLGASGLSLMSERYGVGI